MTLSDLPDGSPVWALVNMSGDIAIAITFFSIALIQLYILLSRKDIAFRGILILFTGIFALLATSHVLHFLNLADQYNFLEGLIKISTGILTLCAFLKILRDLPDTLAFPSKSDLIQQKRELSRTENDLWAAIALLEERVEERTRELAALSVTDALTRIKNRRGLMDSLEQEMQRSHRYQQPLSILLIDLDNFKAINDQFGHNGGDAVLIATARILTGISRSADVVGRYGGEEFLAILPQTSEEEALQLGQRLCQEVAANRVSMNQREIAFTCSIGITELSPTDNRDELLQRADQGLYEAKRRGKNQIILGKAG